MGKRISKVVLILFGAIIIGLIAASFVIKTQNDKVAKNIVREIKNIPVPEKTSIEDEVCAVGKLSGNGDGMQYFGAVLLKSEELQEYYGEYADSKYSDIVARQDNERVEVVEHRELRFNTDIDTEDYYIVYTWGDYDGIASELDLRGIG